MDLLNYSETFRTYWPVCFVAFACTALTNWCINNLYSKKLQSGLLSFPEQLEQRARFRKPLLFLLLVLCFGKAWTLASELHLAYLCIAIALLSLVTITDFEQHVIFDATLLPLAICGVAYTLYLQFPLTEHLAAGFGGGFLFFVLTLLTKGAIGGGDIKLIATLGLWLGIKPLITVIIYGAIAGGLAALLLLLLKKTTRKQFLAYGPYFALTAIGVLLNFLRV